MFQLLFSLIFITQIHAADKVVSTVTTQEVLQSKIQSVTPLSFEELAQVYSQKSVVLDCFLENPNSQVSKEAQEVFKGFLPNSPQLTLNFTVQPQGDGFNILVARDSAEFDPQNILECNAEEYKCPSLLWSSTKTVILTQDSYVPEAEASENYEFYATKDGKFYATYRYSISAQKYGFLNRIEPAETAEVRFLCRN